MCDADVEILRRGLSDGVNSAADVVPTIELDTRDGNGEWGGRALDMTLTGTAGSVDTTGEEFRLRVGLKSSWFTMRVTG